MNYHVMVDIEALGTGNNALPISIGAVKFTKDTILDKFEVGIDPEDAQRYGRTITGSTVMWWFDPARDEARKRIFDMPKVDLASAMQGFADWCSICPEVTDVVGTHYVDAGEIVPGLEQRATLCTLGSLWGNGAIFDNVILEGAAVATHTEWPFDFRRNECYRTLKNRNPDVEFTRHGIHHSAVDDALSQALHLQRICAARGFEL